jgi:hypothetical protein
MFATGHALAMRNIPVGHSYGVPIPTDVLWSIVDFPISWVLFLSFDFDSNTPLLVAGTLQWGLWGYLLGYWIAALAGARTRR